MVPVGIFLLVGAVIALNIVFRLFAGSLDHERITAYVISRGGRVDSIVWSPFGRGWFGSKSERIYDVAYIDSNGQYHRATCKTSMLSGVYFTEDTLLTVHRPTADRLIKDEHSSSLEEENRRLREEVERLRKARQE